VLSLLGRLFFRVSSEEPFGPQPLHQGFNRGEHLGTRGPGLGHSEQSLTMAELFCHEAEVCERERPRPSASWERGQRGVLHRGKTRLRRDTKHRRRLDRKLPYRGISSSGHKERAVVS